jgi:hypothetical protein
MPSFPKANIQTCKEDDPMMKRVDQDNGEIGSRPSGMPKSMDGERMSINHVGDSNRQK